MVNLEQLSQPSAVQLARAGDFRAIAYWLNVCLVPQGIYARVAADRPGVLLVLLEFLRQPQRDRLNQLVCHRISRLNSSLIHGVRIITRYIDSDEILWDASIRLRRLPAPSQPRAIVSQRSMSPQAPSRRSRAGSSQRRSSHQRGANLPPTPTRRPQPRPIAPYSISDYVGAPYTSRAPYPAQPTRKRRSPQHFQTHHSYSHSHSNAKPRKSQSHRTSPQSSHPKRRIKRRRHARPLTVPHWYTSSLMLSKRYSYLFANSLYSSAHSLAEAARNISPSQLKLAATTAAAVVMLGGSIELWNQYGPELAFGNQRPNTVRTAQGKVPVTPAASGTPNSAITLTFSGSPDFNPAVLQPAVDPNGSTASGVQRFTHASFTGASGAAIDSVASNTAVPPDIFLANLDRPLDILGDATTPASLKSLRQSGVGIVNVSSDALAQNGQQGLLKTLDTLKEVGVRPVGAGRNQREARRPEIIDVRGQRIAYLGYADTDEYAAGMWRAGANPALQDRIAEDVKSIRDQVDWVVVNYYWSQDLSSYPADWQVNLAHLAVDSGADLVVGYHPDVLQGAEIYKGRAIAYSLGNFMLTNQPHSEAPDYDSAVLKVAIKDDQMKLEFLPVQVQKSTPAIAQGQKAKTILGYLEQASALFDQPLPTSVVLDRQGGATKPTKPAPAAPSTPTQDSFISYPEPSPEAAPSLSTPTDSFTPSAPDGKRFPQPEGDSTPTAPQPAKQVVPVEQGQDERELNTPDSPSKEFIKPDALGDRQAEPAAKEGPSSEPFSDGATTSNPESESGFTTDGFTKEGFTDGNAVDFIR
ncbi:CapA family protein [Leptolyngbya sp. AN02str]|uniref:CapA family protein n=1 Tax=Leptolyngbya sp. AN02str TaxID=3423363 RepID=UPI003D3232F7